MTADGGAISNLGTATITDTTFRFNVAQIQPTAPLGMTSIFARGGAIFSSGPLTITGGAINNSLAVATAPAGGPAGDALAEGAGRGRGASRRPRGAFGDPRFGLAADKPVPHDVGLDLALVLATDGSIVSGTGAATLDLQGTLPDGSAARLGGTATVSVVGTTATLTLDATGQLGALALERSSLSVALVGRRATITGQFALHFPGGSANLDGRLVYDGDNARLEAEFEVDSNVVGQKWTVTIRDNTVLRHTGTHTTTAPSGSFTARSLMPDMAGDDRIVARATNPATGEICVGRVTYPA